MHSKPRIPKVIPVAPGLPYLGDVPAMEGVIFEFSSTGPDLRLFFPDTTAQERWQVQHAPIHLGLMRFEQLGIVAWKIGDCLQGDAQFHVGMNFDGFRPAPGDITAREAKIPLQLIDSISRMFLAVRFMKPLPRFLQLMDDIVADQLRQSITRQAYDRQIDAFHQAFNAGTKQVIDAADIFEQVCAQHRRLGRPILLTLASQCPR